MEKNRIQSVSWLSVTLTNIWDNQLTTQEVTFSSQFWQTMPVGVCRAVHHRREQIIKFPSLQAKMWDRRANDFIWDHTPLKSKPPTILHLWNIPSSSSIIKMRTKHLTQKALGYSPNTNCSKKHVCNTCPCFKIGYSHKTVMLYFKTMILKNFVLRTTLYSGNCWESASTFLFVSYTY